MAVSKELIEEDLKFVREWALEDGAFTVDVGASFVELLELDKKARESGTESPFPKGLKTAIVERVAALKEDPGEWMAMFCEFLNCVDGRIEDEPWKGYALKVLPRVRNFPYQRYSDGQWWWNKLVWMYALIGVGV